MAVQLGMTLDGAKEVLEGLALLPIGLQKKYLRATVNKVTKPHLSAVKSLVARGPTGNLRRSVGIVTEAKVRGRTQTAVLGFRRGEPGGANSKKSGYHAWFVEDGVNDRYPKGRALRIPLKYARQYPYVKNLINVPGGVKQTQNLAIDTWAAYLKSIRGFAGTGRFASFADSTLPSIRDALQRELIGALEKARAEAARRAARKAQGK